MLNDDNLPFIFKRQKDTTNNLFMNYPLSNEQTKGIIERELCRRALQGEIKAVYAYFDLGMKVQINDIERELCRRALQGEIEAVYTYFDLGMKVQINDIERELCRRALQGEIEAVYAYFDLGMKVQINDAESKRLEHFREMIDNHGIKNNIGKIRSVEQDSKLTGRDMDKGGYPSRAANGRGSRVLHYFSKKFNRFRGIKKNADKARSVEQNSKLTGRDMDKGGYLPFAANEYGSMVKVVTPLIQYFRDASKLNGVRTVVDVGAADGWNLDEIYRKGKATVIAIEPANSSLEKIHDRFKEIPSGTYIALNEGTNTYHLKPNSVDTMLCSHVMHYLYEKEVIDFIQRSVKALKPGGKLFLQMFSIWSSHNYNSLRGKKGLIYSNKGQQKPVNEGNNFLYTDKKKINHYLTEKGKIYLERMIEKQGNGQSIQDMVGDTGIWKMCNFFTAEYFEYLVNNHPDLKGFNLNIETMYFSLTGNWISDDPMDTLGVILTKRKKNS